MKKYLSYLQTYISFLALGLSIAALCVAYPRSSNTGFDYLGFIVTILGILVAILIGWQLFNAFNLKELVTQTEKAKKEAVEASEKANEMLNETKVESNQISQRIEELRVECNDLQSKIKKLSEELNQKLDKKEVQYLSDGESLELVKDSFSDAKTNENTSNKCEDT